MSLKELLERHQQLELQLMVAREREAEIALTDQGTGASPGVQSGVSREFGC
jgi:hypothetical protein